MEKKTSFQKFSTSKYFAELQDANKERRKSIQIDLKKIDEAYGYMREVLDAYNNSTWAKLERLPNEMTAILSDAEALIDRASQAQMKALQTAEEIKEMAKELGIEEPKELKKIYADNHYDDLIEGYNRDLDRLFAIIKKF